MSTPEERIHALQLPPAWRWRPHPATDYIDMEYFLETDFGIRTQLTVTRLETMASVHKTIAEGLAHSAAIIGGRGKAK